MDKYTSVIYMSPGSTQNYMFSGGGVVNLGTLVKVSLEYKENFLMLTMLREVCQIKLLWGFRVVARISHICADLGAVWRLSRMRR